MKAFCLLTNTFIMAILALGKAEAGKRNIPVNWRERESSVESNSTGRVRERERGECVS